MEITVLYDDMGLRGLAVSYFKEGSD